MFLIFEFLKIGFLFFKNTFTVTCLTPIGRNAWLHDVIVPLRAISKAMTINTEYIYVFMQRYYYSHTKRSTMYVTSLVT